MATAVLVNEKGEYLQLTKGMKDLHFTTNESDLGIYLNESYADKIAEKLKLKVLKKTFNAQKFVENSCGRVKIG